MTFLTGYIRNLIKDEEHGWRVLAQITPQFFDASLTENNMNLMEISYAISDARHTKFVEGKTTISG
jgi:hypothetical protein